MYVYKCKHQNFPCVATIFPVLHLNPLCFPCLENLTSKFPVRGHPVFVTVSSSANNRWLFNLLQQTVSEVKVEDGKVYVLYHSELSLEPYPETL